MLWSAKDKAVMFFLFISIILILVYAPYYLVYYLFEDKVHGVLASILVVFIYLIYMNVSSENDLKHKLYKELDEVNKRLNAIESKDSV